MKTGVWRQQTRDGDRKMSNRGEERKRMRDEERERRKGDVSACRNKEVPEDTGDSLKSAVFHSLSKFWCFLLATAA